MYGEKEDMFTEMRNQIGKDQITSKVESIKDNPEKEEPTSKEGLKKMGQRLKTLKKDQHKLKNTLEKEFNNFKNLFYQI